eukprot:GFYU01015415.1.p1 GENE.GFYU01015415.1~~GFYU01015415.1.p1  ORF type:complete len:349 (-),score=166.38 GFYU01015415.1:144-1082(-)
MVGKKLQRDIQVYEEVVETVDLDKARKSWGDHDELDEEQRERELKNHSNKRFHVFAEEVQRLSKDSIEFDVPYRELGFYGVPGKSNVFLMPTVNCLVDLSEFPSFVTTLDDVELVYFERVVLGIQNIDMAIVYKDYTKAVTRIGAVPMRAIDSIKQWLDSVDILYYEGNTNLNWSKILQTVRNDPTGFFETGGWDFLAANAGSDEEEEEESEESEFEMEGEESDFDESDDDSELDDSAEESDSSDFENDDDLSEDGLSWDEMEKKAVKEDRKKDFGEDTKPKSKKARRRDEYSESEPDSEEKRPKKKKKKTK